MPAGLVSPVESITLALDRWRAGDGVEVLRSEFLDVLASVPDPRDPRGRRYPLAGLLAISILATAAGMRGYAGFATWAATAPAEVLSRLGIRFRRPSEKTFRSVLSRLDPADLDRRFGAYFTTVAAAETVATGGLLAVALDGKTLRAARRMGAAATHLVAVFAHRARLVLGQLAVAEKSNEIPCVRKLLRTFRKARLLVTVDAMHTQTATAKLICGTLKSHYLMIVKSNQPKLLARIQALPWAQIPLTHSEDSQPAHGRIETRTLKVLTTVRGIGFPHARQVIQITRDRVAVATGERSREVVYAICSVAFEHAHPRVIATWLREHWSIENAVHWVRDVTFDEDRSTVRTGTAPQVMASLRNTALNLHRLAGSDNIAEACRVTAFSADRGLNLLPCGGSELWSLHVRAYLGSFGYR
jgi:predicted transposase YbfD/YdcC